MLVAHQAKGAGYAISKPEELQTVIDVAQTTGDPSSALLPPFSGYLRMFGGWRVKDCHHSRE